MIVLFVISLKKTTDLTFQTLVKKLALIAQHLLDLPVTVSFILYECHFLAVLEKRVGHGHLSSFS